MTEFSAKQRSLEVERMEKDASLCAEIDLREKEFYALQAQGMHELRVSMRPPKAVQLAFH
jgi:hypothetical protein